MFVFLVLIVGILNSCKTQSNTGTTIFNNKQIDADCWTKEELNKLRARQIFNQIIPKQTTPANISKAFIKDVLRYYKKALRTVDKQVNPQCASVLREALADTIGGHMKSELLPAARLAYYAGYVPYKQVRDLHNFYDDLKMSLNTAGLGWKSPSKFPEIANMTVVKISIGPGKFFNPCGRLVIKRDSNNACIQLPTPRVDDVNEPTAIALPFKNGGLINMLSPSSENILLKYYTTASRCILRRSPAICRHADIVSFNNDLWCWMKDEIAPHLMDEKLNAAFGGVLRVAAAVQNYGKVLTKRKIFDMNSRTDLRTLVEPYCYDCYCTPCIYILIVILAAIVILLLQIFYNYIFGNIGPCFGLQKEKPETPILSQYEVRDLESSINKHNESCLYCSPDQNKFPANISPKTQRVYDYNENLLDVIMSDAEEDNYCSSDSSNNEYANKTLNNHYDTEVKAGARSTSPPKIETSIEQLKINKGRVGIVSDKLETRDQWAWTEEASSSCSESLSTGSSTSRPRARDLAWARRVVDSERSHSPRTKAALNAEMDSNTTSSSQR